MKGRCFLCDKHETTPYHVTEIREDKTVDSFDMCMSCGQDYIRDLLKLDKPVVKEPVLDLTNVQTPAELLNFITQHTEIKSPCPGCGLKLSEFDKYGKFGCAKCYEHFHERMDQLVYPYHGAEYHIGKSPKQQQKPDEELTILKLKLAHAIEFEEYEDAAKIKKQIELLENS